MNKEKNLKDQRASLQVDTRETQQITLYEHYTGHLVMSVKRAKTQITAWGVQRQQLSNPTQESANQGPVFVRKHSITWTKIILMFIP